MKPQVHKVELGATVQKANWVQEKLYREGAQAMSLSWVKPFNQAAQKNSSFFSLYAKALEKERRENV
jgi:hypothetical protein